jgi:hypothetical protein
MINLLANWSYARALLVASLLSITGCAIQLAPSFDKNVVEGLNLANTEVMTLMASTSEGTDKNTFSSRKEKYNTLIGKADALALSAGARPMPKNKITDAINKLLEKRGGKPIDDDDATPASAQSIRRVAETLTKMRDTDKKQGITTHEAHAFKKQLAIYLDQAITYENFLQR